MTLRVDTNYETVYSAPLNKRSAEKYENCIFDAQSSDKTAAERKAKTGAARYKAIQDSTLVYYKESTEQPYLFGIIKLPSKQKPAYYEYTANGKETIYQIKQRFGIKDGAIEKFNPSYKESSPAYKESTEACRPSAGTKIRFYAYDVE